MSMLELMNTIQTDMLGVQALWERHLKNPDNTLNILPDESLPGHSKPVQFVLTGDEAFPLSIKVQVLVLNRVTK